MNSRSHNSAYSRLMVLSDLGQNAVIPAGKGSLRLANGQIGLFRMADKTSKGPAAVANMDGNPKEDLYQIQVGTGRTQEAGGMTNKNFSTIAFRRDDVLDVTFDRAKAPVYSEVTLGYNGTAGTGIKLKENEATTVSLKLFGEQLSYLGFRDGVANLQFNVFSGSPEACDNCLNPCATTSCQSIVEDLVETIRDYELRAGSDAGTGASIKVGDLVEVIGTSSCTPDLYAEGSAVTYYTLERCDEGNGEALAQVQAWVNADTNLGSLDVDVERITREGSTSTYQVIASAAPSADFAEPATLNRNGDEVVKVVTDCETCPAGATTVSGLYRWKLVIDAGIYDLATLTTAIETTSISVGGADITLVGRAAGPIDSETWIIVGDANPTDAALRAAIIAGAAGITSAAQFELSAYAAEDTVCLIAYSADTIAWTTGKTCSVYTRSLEIIVDLECGPYATDAARDAKRAEKLAELQAAFPELSVTADTTEPPSTSTLFTECRNRFFGTQTSEPVCEGCETADPIFPDMPEDFDFESWSLKTVGAGEITSFTVATDTISIGGADDGGTELVTEASTAVTTKPAGSEFDLRVTLDTTAVEPVKVVLVNVSAPSSGFAVGDTIVIDISASPFAGASSGTITLTITGVGGAYPDDCECGIKFVAKNAFLCPPAMLADQIGTFTPKGVKIQVSGGEAPAVLMEGYQFVTTPFRVTRHERDFDGTGWGVNYMKQEKASAEYFAGISPRRSYAEGYLSGFETKLEPCVQYDKFTVKLKRNPYAGTASRRMGEEIRYIFLIPSDTVCSYTSIIDALGGSVGCEGEA